MDARYGCIVAILAGLVMFTNAKVFQVTDENWGEVVEGEWMLKFYAPWCPACKAIAPVWTDFSSQAKGLGIRVGEIDVSASPGLSGRFMVTSLPTIFHVRNGEFRVYSGSRGKEDFVGYIANKRYKEIEPVSSWKAPNSIIMTVVSLIFQLSMKVRTFHLIMTTEYGFPAWSVYGFFAVCTVLMGLMLGMVLVFITDCVCPTRHPTRPLPPPSPAPEEGQEEPVDTKKDEVEQDETQDAAAASAESEATEETGDTSLRKRKTDTKPSEDEN